MLQLDRIRVPIGRLRAVGPISLSLPTGQWLGLLGPAGSGKTVVARIAAGLLKPPTGRRLFTEPADRARVLVEGRGVRFVPGDEPFDLRLTPREVLTTRARLRGYSGRPLRRMVDEAVDRWGLASVWRQPLAAQRRAVRRRVALADAFLGQPGLVILDDPFWGCDDAPVRAMRAAMRRGDNGSVAVLIASRSPNELSPLTSQVMELGHTGRALYVGDWSGWRAKRLTPMTYRLVAKGPGGAIERMLRRVDGVAGVLWHEGGVYNAFELRVAPSPRIRETIFRLMAEKSWPIVELQPEPQPYLEESAYARALNVAPVRRVPLGRRPAGPAPAGGNGQVPSRAVGTATTASATAEPAPADIELTERAESAAAATTAPVALTPVPSEREGGGS